MFRFFETKEGGQLPVLSEINLGIKEGEFVSLLGPSGSGKSTLLRIMAGLIKPSSGTVAYLGERIEGINPGVSMVFQSFALFPWLTVLENVMMGLEDKPFPKEEKRERAIKMIDIIGLDGFENAYPKELSGGMKQRVGLGRALVSEPDILLMDEPFSALDVLTAENLRRDILDLWHEGKIPAKCIVMVTHGIEEAVLMSDRVVILSKSPARIREQIAINLKRPRDSKHPSFEKMLDRIYSLLMQPEKKQFYPDQNIKDELIHFVAIGALTGFLELLADFKEKQDLYALAEKLSMEIDDFVPIVDSASLLQFTKVETGDIELTKKGFEFAEASVLDRKKIFKEQFVANVPLARKILTVLESKSNHHMNYEFFEDMLEKYFSAENVEKQIDTLIDWGRYSELFAYNEVSGQFYLEQGEFEIEEEKDEN
ncbi:MAG: nitrate/sulfonate/bicarbonate ABC transporter ATP-binding protein [Fusobacteria bacterium]|nr:nitrate/sulfonate/bicarbonate ABC transporter ATP-binding protein [Fusobacteriota bacterium]